MAEGRLPDLEGINRLLERWREKTAYVMPMTGRSGRLIGNNGDTLMHAVFSMILKDADVRVTEKPEEADVVVVPPSGALLEAYSFPDILQERLKEYPATPLLIFPSSALFPRRDPSFMFSGRSADTTWVLREANSFEHLQKDWGAGLTKAGVELVLDHDVVASGHQFVPRLMGAGTQTTGRHLLVAARVDREASNFGAAVENPAPRSNVLTAGANLVPYGPVRTYMTRQLRKRKIRETSDRLIRTLPNEVRSKLEQRTPRARKDVDASANQYCTFDEYKSAIRNAHSVVTNRLHVALPAAILGKQVVLVEAGYHKLGGVYSRSLQDMPNVRFIDAPR